jgi:orotidine-5'-phosphate decarboxylase
MSQSPFSQQEEIKAQKAAKGHIVVSLDGVSPDKGLSLDQVTALVKQLRDLVGFFRVDYALCPYADMAWMIESIKEVGGSVFLDLKVYGKPEDMAATVSQAAELGGDLISVDATSGFDALQAAVQNRGKAKILGAIPFLSPQESFRFYGKPPEGVAMELGALVQQAQCDGIICRPDMLHLVSHLPVGLKGGRYVERGRSPASTGVATPVGALEAGANLLVINWAPFLPYVSMGTPRDRFWAIRQEILRFLLQQQRK